MKKYLKLTASQAIRHFILRDNSFAPRTDEDIDQKLALLDRGRGRMCVSIVMPTHRIRPETKKDVITLKNLVGETEKELHATMDKRTAAALMENIREAADAVDFSLNLDSLVIYANEFSSTIVKLPVDSVASVMVGDDFDLTPLYRTRQQNRRYYLITVSRHLIRLIEGFNERPDHEVDNDDFPFTNEDYYTDDPKKLEQDIFTDNLIKEYFNVSDKAFQKLWNENPLPTILMGDVKAVAYYHEQMDNKEMVAGFVHGSYDTMSPLQIVESALPVLDEYRRLRSRQYLDEIENAQSAGLAVTGIDNIIEAIRVGGVRKLYVSNGLNLDSPEASAGNDHHTGKEIHTHDRLHNVLKEAAAGGGEIIFTSPEILAKYGGIVLTRRY